MNTVLIWIFIAIIGLLLYLAPSYLSEGFDPSPLGAINPNIDPSNYKDITSIQDFLTNTPNFENSPELPKPIPIPPPEPISSATSLPSQTMEINNPTKVSLLIEPSKKELSNFDTPPISKANDNKFDLDDSLVPSQNKNKKNAGSDPADAELTDKLSDFLEQGASFNTNKNKLAKKIPDHDNTINEKCPEPVCPKPVCPQPVCPPQQVCPPPKKCPTKQCPDMSNYVRKDKIPCWGCSL